MKVIAGVALLVYGIGQLFYALTQPDLASLVFCMMLGCCAVGLALIVIVRGLRAAL